MNDKIYIVYSWLQLADEIDNPMDGILIESHCQHQKPEDSRCTERN